MAMEIDPAREMRHRPQAGSPDRAHHPRRVSEAGPPPSSHHPEAKLGERDRTGPEHHRKADNAMADDKAKIDWKMLEASDAEPAQEEAVSPPSPAPTPASIAAPAPGPASPASPAGKIVFHCSNGHRIVVAATMGRQRGKCSKCGVAVRIPASSESPATPGRAAEARVGETGAEAAAESPAVEEAVHASGMDDRFGGVSNQQAPDHDDSHAVGQSAAREDMFSSLVTASDSHASATEFVGFSTPALQASEPEPGPGGPEGGSNPTARLMDRLFREMEHGGIVEVHITGGSVILPEFYEPRWSVGSHGLFASRAADGTVTLTAVAWDSIQKIVVRQVEGLPDGMFE